ncbi:MAG: DUF5110 domain-containing protein, partial [Clostridia bacterium]|nr:DUF5110 domain-containing protein [Clostridia bacterium]
MEIGNDMKLRQWYEPLAKSSSVVKGKNYRFTVLTDALIRMEYDQEGIFEDRATQLALNRDFPTVEFSVLETEQRLTITTPTIRLTYYKDRPFSPSTLFAEYVYNPASASPNPMWRYGEDNGQNLKGTVCTLDFTDCGKELEDGVLSRDGFAVLDDSASMLFDGNGWYGFRDREQVDIYLFAYRNRYFEAVKALFALSGHAPLLPRYALGNMWSRFYHYRQQEYLDLMDRFEREGYPFSVAVIDMNWHKYTENHLHKGWTGYSWEKDLIPDPEDFLLQLHKRNLQVTLNLHPRDGICPQEDRYAEMAKAMGVTDGSPIPFDFGDPKFIENYFKIILHPLEKKGVNFWWIDWQQGRFNIDRGFDPLWLINHYHVEDLKKRNQRPLIMSRNAGIGSHRYPIGFSGDVRITWESFQFQPYFNATASNVGYTWWSNDIGGFNDGIRDDELYARWIQLGAFSPICRMHSGLAPLISKEPWNFDEVSQQVAKKYLRLRHGLIPYLYTMNHKTHTEGIPLITPLYYHHPEIECAYNTKFRNEYYFGKDILVLPITAHSDPVTRMGSVEAYIPEGTWFDFFNGRKYRGNRTGKLFRNLSELPVLVRAGGIVPLSEDISNDVSNPKTLRLRVFAGANGAFELYEDDGISMEYRNGSYVTTKFSLQHFAKPLFTISAPQGDLSLIPETRDYIVEWNGYTDCDAFEVTENGQSIHFEFVFREGRTEIRLK